MTIQNGNRTLRGWVVYPRGKGKAPVVLVLHEVFGLTDSTRNTADEIAAMGYIAITPDLLSGYGPDGGNSESFEPPVSASQVSTTLRDEAVNSDIDAWADFGEKLPQAEKIFDIVGLSWGGGAAFRYITYTQRKDLKALCIFYDVGPPPETQHFPGAPATLSVAGIQVPVYGFYPSQDNRVMKSLPVTKDAMAAAAKMYDPVVYQDAEHAYMRLGEDPVNSNPANAQALKESLGRLKQIFANTLTAR